MLLAKQDTELTQNHSECCVLLLQGAKGTNKGTTNNRRQEMACETRAGLLRLSNLAGRQAGQDRVWELLGGGKKKVVGSRRALVSRVATVVRTHSRNDEA